LSERPGGLRLRRWVAAAWLLGALVFLRAFVFAPYHIPSGSMEDTLLVGDYLLVEKLSYGALIGSWRLPPLRGLRRGDVVVFRHPLEERDYVKRCIALPGDEVELRADSLFVNGDLLHEPYVKRSSRSPARSYGPAEVPEGQIFVLGDHRDASRDSRSFGTLSARQIRGRAALVYFSWDDDAGQPRWRRLLHPLR